MKWRFLPQHFSKLYRVAFFLFLAPQRLPCKNNIARKSYHLNFYRAYMSSIPNWYYSRCQFASLSFLILHLFDVKRYALRLFTLSASTISAHVDYFQCCFSWKVLIFKKSCTFKHNLFILLLCVCALCSMLWRLSLRVSLFLYAFHAKTKNAHWSDLVKMQSNIEEKGSAHTLTHLIIL